MIFLPCCNRYGSARNGKQLRKRNPELFWRRNYSDAVPVPSVEEPESEVEVPESPPEVPESGVEVPESPPEVPESGVEVPESPPEEPESGIVVLLPSLEVPLSGAGAAVAGGVVGAGSGSSLL